MKFKLICGIKLTPGFGNLINAGELIDGYFPLGTNYNASIGHDGTDLIVSVQRWHWDSFDEPLNTDSYPVNGQLWDDTSFEVYLNPGLENTRGYDSNDLVRIYGFPQRDTLPAIPAIVHGINSRLSIEDNAKCTIEAPRTDKNDTVTVCELRFNLAQMGIDLVSNNEIGIDIHYNNDSDGGARDAKFSACSSDSLTAWEDMSKVTCSVLLRPNN